jgi:DNA-binding transcriptional regulator YiaG
MNRETFFLTGEDVRTEPYRYRACGLDGIYLLNGYHIEEHDGEEHVSISDLEGLHQAIGRHLVVNRKGLAPKEVRFLRNTMNLTQAQLAEMLGNNSQSVSRWEKGECEMPGTSEKLLRAVFLASLMSDAELYALRDFLTKRLGELDAMDELTAAPAQFQLYDHWTEKLAA